jgi:hypothetical protein
LNSVSKCAGVRTHGSIDFGLDPSLRFLEIGYLASRGPLSFRRRGVLSTVASRGLTGRFRQAKQRATATTPRAARSSTVSVRVYSFGP